MGRIWHTWLLGLSAVVVAVLVAMAGAAAFGLPLFALGLAVEVPPWAFNAAAVAGALIVGPYLFARHYLLAPDLTRQLRDSIPARTRKAD